MSKGIVNESSMTTVSNAIRKNTGETELIKPSEFASKVEDVYEAGKKAEHDAFWDIFQSNGNLTSYSYAFAYGKWNDDTFRPKYDIKPTSAVYMFAYNNTDSTGTNSQYCISDLKACLEKAGVTLDTSNATYMNQMFYMGNGYTHIPAISFESCTALNATFYGCRQLQTIDKLIFKADGANTVTTNSWDSPFGQCISLKNIVIEGTIGDNIDFSVSPLTKASITSVINALSPTSTKKSATFKKSAKEKAFTDDEWADLIKTKPNWNILLA